MYLPGPIENGEPTHLINTFQNIRKEQNLIHKLIKALFYLSSANDAIIIIDCNNLPMPNTLNH
jgi:hypothetical protein